MLCGKSHVRACVRTSLVQALNELVLRASSQVLPQQRSAVESASISSIGVSFTGSGCNVADRKRSAVRQSEGAVDSRLVGEKVDHRVLTLEVPRRAVQRSAVLKDVAKWHREHAKSVILRAMARCARATVF